MRAPRIAGISAGSTVVVPAGCWAVIDTSFCLDITLSIYSYMFLLIESYTVLPSRIAMIRFRSSPEANSMVIRPLSRPMFTFTRVSK